MTTHTVESLMALARDHRNAQSWLEIEATAKALRAALTAHDALPQEPLTDEQIDMMWRRAGIANNARGAFFAGVAAERN